MFHDYTGELLKTEYAYGYNVFLNPCFYRTNSAYFFKIAMFHKQSFK